MSAEPLAGSAIVRVLSVPAGHDYVRKAVGGAASVHLVPDPPVPGGEPGQWWPHGAFDIDWLRRNADAYDVVHLHFGFEHLNPAALTDWLAELDDLDLPLVVTVHDLVSPHLADQEPYAQLLDVLVPQADALITLTQGAADQVRMRWGRDPLVLPHLHVLPLPLEPREPAPPGSPVIVGTHLKSLRSNVDVATAVAAFLLLADDTDVPLLMDVNDDIADRLPTALTDNAVRLGLSLHPRFTDNQLRHWLHTIDVMVLPYSHGTHSGLLDAGLDAGARVVAPMIGNFAEQGPVVGYAAGDPGSLAQAVRAAVEEVRQWRARGQPAPAWQATTRQRLADTEHVTAAHARLYTTLADRQRP